MNEKCGSWTQERLESLDNVISYIEHNYQRQDLYAGITNIKLFEHQKFLIKQILNGNTITFGARQMGLTSLYSWFASAYCQLHYQKSNILILMSRHAQIHSRAMIVQICNRKFGIEALKYFKSKDKIVFQNGSIIKFKSILAVIDPSQLANNDFVFIQADVCTAENLNTIIDYTTNHKLNNINISFNMPRNTDDMSKSKLHAIWRAALIQKNQFKAIYLPWYLHPNRLNFKEYYQKQSEYIGGLNIHQELLV